MMKTLHKSGASIAFDKLTCLSIEGVGIEMLKKIFFCYSILLVFQITTVSAQSVGIGTESPNHNAVLELVSSENNQGLLVPRLTTNQRTAALFVDGLSADEDGLMVFDTDVNKFFFWITDQWVELAVGNLNGLPDQVGHGGKYLTTDGTNALWSSLDFDDLTNIPAGISDGDNDTQLTEAEVDGFVADNGYLTGIANNSVTSAKIAAGAVTNVKITDMAYSKLTGIPADLSDGDDDTQLNETEVDDFVANNGYLTGIANNSVTSAKIAAGAVTDAKISDMAYSKLTGIPADLSDGDDDTQLNETEVDDFVANNGYLTTIANSSISTAKIANGAVTNVKIADVAYSKLTGIPADLSDGDDDTQLNETEVDDFVANNGYLTTIANNSITSVKIATGAVTNAKIADVAYSKLTGIPADLSDGDDDTQLSESEVDDFVANNGYLSAIPNSAITTAKIATGAVTNAKISDMAYSKLTGIPADLSDGDDDTQLSETEVDDFVANNGYLTEIANNSVTAAKISNFQVSSSKLSSLSVSTAKIQNGAVTDAKITSMDFDKLTNVPAGLSNGDQNTQLSEGQVDNYVSNNGYLQVTVSGTQTLSSGGNNVATPSDRVVQLKGGAAGESAVNTLGTGSDGQEAILVNVGTSTINVVAGAAGNNTEIVLAAGANHVLKSLSILHLMYSAQLKAWIQIGSSGNTSN